MFPAVFLLFSQLALLCSAKPKLAADCTDGVLVVGGKTSAGPTAKIDLAVRGPNWCQNSGFPDLPEPLVSPGAYFSNDYLLVCGFSGNSSCKATKRGWSSWQDVPSMETEEQFKMAFLVAQGGASVNMLSKETEAARGNDNHLQSLIFSSGEPQWKEMTGNSSPFNLDYRDFETACFRSFGFGKFIIAGGYKTEPCWRCIDYGSSASVGIWNQDGSTCCGASPAFEDGVIPDMREARETHACSEFGQSFVVSGGYYYHYGASQGGSSTIFEPKASAEYFDGTNWIGMDNMWHARSNFGLQTMCGALYAFGGVQMEDRDTDAKFLSSVEVIWSLSDEWAELLGSNQMPEAKGYFASIPVTGMECW